MHIKGPLGTKGSGKVNGDLIFRKNASLVIKRGLRYNTSHR